MRELDVPFVEKDQAKRLGARWNAASKRWYVPDGIDLQKFARWLPDGVDVVAAEDNLYTNPVVEDDKKVTLANFLQQVSAVVQNSFPSGTWVSAEISELRSNKGHLFITLVEHDEQGNMIARISARVWQSQAQVICAKFLQGTGAELEAGIKVLVYARIEFHAQYGMALFIDDIDPNYTLGDMAAKLAKIREVLVAEQIIDLNKQLPRPHDFYKVAVISPQNAAGLGDFNREAQLLIKYGLCQFTYFTAQFQGENATKDICRAIEEAKLALPFDALVIIRGGGAISDLAWLNNEQIARAVCNFPVHVMVGIGHERDYTILDEVAGERFDTPSKVSHRIFSLVSNNALEADKRYQDISQTARGMLQRTLERATLIYEQIGVQAKQGCIAVQKHMQSLISEILSQSPRQILQKGFAIVSNKCGKVVSSSNEASAEEILTLEFHDGKTNVRKI